jgi:hypothetical protein
MVHKNIVSCWDAAFKLLGLRLAKTSTLEWVLFSWSIVLALIALLPACASGVPGQTLLLSDSFDDASGGWALAHNDQADIAIAGGQLTIAIKQPDSLAWSVLGGKSFGDFTLDVDATPLAGPDDNDYGVIARHVDDENFYRFEISGDGYFNVQKRLKGKWEKLVSDWSPSEAIHKGKVINHLRVVCQGASMTFFVNQVQLVQITDASFARGAVGVLAGSLAQPDVQIAFDNVQVSK